MSTPSPVQLTLPQKVRGFIVDEISGDPIQGVVVQAVAQAREKLDIPLGLLVSDAAGYVSFDLRPLQDLGLKDLDHLWIGAVGSPVSRVDLVVPLSKDSFGSPGMSSANLQANNPPHLYQAIFALKTNNRLSRSESRQIRLSSIQNPDIGDWELSPYSFVAKKGAILGENNCEVLVPSAEAEREYRFTQVVRKTTARPSLSDDRPRAALSRAGQMPGSSAAFSLAPLDPRGDFEHIPDSMQVSYGEVLEFKQTWKPKGHALGAILYSTALAPCESVDIAVVDWARKDDIMRSDAIISNESLYHSQRRDRIIDEAVDAALNESQGGWSLLGGHGGAAAATVPIYGVPVNFGGTLAVGGSVSKSWGDRDLTAESIQDLHDSVVQATTVSRSFNSTVVVQASQEEHNYLQTRTVTNHNHCHALTVEYYEVLRHFKVITEYVRSRQVALIPYKLISFDHGNVIRFRRILEAVILDPGLRKCFDAVVRLDYCADLYTVQPPQPAEKGPAQPSTEPSTPASPDKGATPGSSSEAAGPKKMGSWKVSNAVVNTGVFVKKGSTVLVTASGQVDFGGAVGGFGAPILDADGDNAQTPSDYPAPNLKKNSLICKIGTQWYQGGTSTSFTTTEDGLLILQPNDKDLSDNSRGWDVEVYVTPPTTNNAPSSPPGSISGQATGSSSEAAGPKKMGSWKVSNAVVNTGVFVKKGSTVLVTASGQVDFGGAVGGFGAPILDADGDNAQTPSDYPAPNLKKNSLICKIGTQWYQGGTSTSFTTTEDGLLILQPNDKDLSDNSRGWDVEVYVTPPTTNNGSDSATPDSRALSKTDDACCEQRLLVHLNSNLGYYNRAIWLLQDPTERVMMLNAALAGSSMLEQIDTTPIAVSGNYVAFPYNEQPADLEKDSRRRKENPPTESILAVPTRGVFAETSLSNCNSCEERDVTRFWKWDEAPCERPPTIEGITPGPRGQTPTVEPTTLPSPVVQIMQPPAAPDPTGLAAALTLLGQPNIFRDMSGMKELEDLLSGLASGAVSLAQGQQQLEALKQRLASQSRAGGANDGTGRSAFEPDAAKQVDRLKTLDYAKQKGLIDGQTASRAASGTLGGDIFLTSGGTKSGEAGAISKVTDVLGDVTTDVIKGIVAKFIDIPKLEMDKIENGASLIAGYKDVTKYRASPPPMDMKREIHVRFDNLGGGPFLNGFTGQLDISWVDNWYLDRRAMTANDKKRWLELQTIMCKTRITASPKGMVGAAWSKVEVKLDLVVEEPINEWKSEIDFHDNVVLRPDTTLVITLNLEPVIGPGGTISFPIRIDLDPMTETPMWYIVQDNDGEGPDPFEVLEFRLGPPPFKT